MPVQMPPTTPVQKASRHRLRHKYSAARAFYLTIVIISVIAISSLFKGRSQQDINGGRTHLTVTDGFLPGDSRELVPRELVRRDQAVRWTSIRGNSRETLHEAHNTLHSAGSSIRLAINALSFAPTA